MPIDTLRKPPASRRARWATFLAGGVFNTAATYLVYLLLRTFLHYQLAYLIAYCLGIGFAYYFNSQFVFRGRLSLRGLVVYPVVYLVQYALSALCMKLFVEHLRVPEALAPLLTTAITFAVTYLMSKLVIERTQPKADQGDT